jgi:hypothetical protein
MITLFENFNDKINIRNYIVKDKTGVYLIPNYDFLKFGETQENFTQIRYNSLMRFFLYQKLLNYTGSNAIIKYYIQGITSKDPDKIEIINKIPNNNHILRMINDKFNLNYPSYKYNNLNDLAFFVHNYDKILSDINLEEYIKEADFLTKKSKISEKIVKGVIVMLYGNYFNIEKAKTSDDLKGVDIWMTNKENGVKQSIQVKNVSGNINFKIVGDTIYIGNTALDLHEYKSWEKIKLPYDYLGFYIERTKQVCIIKSDAIFVIDKPAPREIKIKLKDIAFKYKSFFKVVDVPKRLLPKDYSKIFY